MPIAVHSSHGIYDGHTLPTAIEDTQRLTGRDIERAYVFLMRPPKSC